jgi:putative resolvase
LTRLEEYADQQGLNVVARVGEVGSGMSGRRAKITLLLRDPEVGTIVVEHRDRLGRMNIELIEAALAGAGRSITVVEESELDDDLVRDMTEVMTSFCARLYGRRGAANRARRAIAQTQVAS